jgi:hypothetical protein
MSQTLEKILIAEVSDNKVWNDFFPFYANVWLVRTNNIYSDLADPDFELENIGLNSDLIVLSFQVHKEPYARVDTIAEVIDTEKTFYFNNDDRTLLIHFEAHRTPYYYSATAIEIGFSLGFFTSPSAIDGEWNSVQYDPRLVNAPSLTDTLDDLFFSKQVMRGATIEINNNDLKYKNFNIGNGVKKKNGNFVRTLIWTGADATTANYEDFEVTYQGIIERITEGRTIRIFLRDLRSSLTVKSPQRYLDTTTYTNIKDPDKEYLLPQLWGKCFDVPVLCLNANVNDAGGTTDYQFLICDTINHTVATNSIQTVYINGKETSLTPTITFDSTQNFALFSIPAIANFRVLDGTGGSTRFENMDKVTIDCHGYLKGSSFRESDGSLTSDPTGLIENGLAVIREIIKNNYGFDYTSTFYDISTWKKFEDDAYKVGYYVSSQQTTQKQIEELASSQLGSFIWDSNLKFNFDNDDFVSYALEIPKHKLFPDDYFPEFDQDSKKVLASLRVGLKRKWGQSGEEERYEWLLDDSNVNNALIDYNSTKIKDFGTLINNATDAQSYATRALVFVGISQDTFSIQTGWDAKDLKAGDWVKVQADHRTEDLIGWVKCQVQEVNPQIDIWMVNLKLRIFGYLSELVRNDVGITHNQKQILIEV